MLLFHIGEGILDTDDSDNPNMKNENEVLVEDINSVPDLSWEASLNSMFFEKNEEELSSFIGVMNEKYAREDSLAHVKQLLEEQVADEGNFEDDDEEFPKQYSAAKEYPHCKSIRQIRDQGPCGGCWAMSAIEALTDRLCIWYAKLGIKFNPVLSYRQMLLCGPGHACHGGSVGKGIDWAKEVGLVTGGESGDEGTCLPGPFKTCAHHEKGSKASCVDAKYVKVPSCDTGCAADMNGEYDFKNTRAYPKGYKYAQGEKKMMKELMENGPLSVSFTCKHDFFFYNKGIYHHVKGDGMGVHATRIIGWGTAEDGLKYWIMTNSWNPEWGLNGVILFKKGEGKTGHMDIEDGAIAPDWGEVTKTSDLMKLLTTMKGADISGDELQNHVTSELSEFDKADWDDKREDLAEQSSSKGNEKESMLKHVYNRLMSRGNDFEEEVEEELGNHGPDNLDEEMVSVDPFNTYFEKETELSTKESELSVTSPSDLMDSNNFWGGLLSFVTGFLVSCCILGCCLRYVKQKTDTNWIPSLGMFEGDTYMTE